MAGIVRYGPLASRNPIRSEEIARQWDKDSAAIETGFDTWRPTLNQWPVQEDPT